MELTEHYISFGFRVTVTGCNSKGDIEARTYTYIGVDKPTCMSHASSQMAENGWSVSIVTVENIDHAFVAIPALMELRSIEVCNLD